MVAEGKLSQETYDHWAGETKGPLPERVGRKPKNFKIQKIKTIKTLK